MAAKKKTATKRGAALSIRIDERTKYGLELLARVQRRSVTGVVEWAIAKVFTYPLKMLDSSGYDDDSTMNEILRRVWHVNEVGRLVALWDYDRTLLTYEESRMMAVLLRTNDFWDSSGQKNFRNFAWSIVEDQWDLIKPLVIEASNKTTVTGLLTDDLTEGGVITF